MSRTVHKVTKIRKSSKAVRTTKTPKASTKRFALYWCTTDDGDEDWFVVADSAREACRFHEDAEGYDRGDAHAERIMALPAAVTENGGWRNGPGKPIETTAGWPSDPLLIACGAQIGNLERDPLREQVGSVCKDVHLRGRLFRAGDLVTNTVLRLGGKETRVSVFKGGKGEK